MGQHMARGWRAGPGLLAGLALLPLPAEAAGVPGAELSLLWAVPFAGILLSIALMPLFAGHLWHHHYGKIAAVWAVLVTVSTGPPSRTARRDTGSGMAFAGRSENPSAVHRRAVDRVVGKAGEMTPAPSIRVAVANDSDV